MTAAIATIVVASVLALGVVATLAFERAVEPELAQRTRLIAATLRDTIQRPIERGVPIQALPGLDGYVTQLRERFDEIEHIAVATATGEVIAESRRPAGASLLRTAGLAPGGQSPIGIHVLPVFDGSREVGRIEVAIRADFVRARLRDVFLDVLVIALVATLVALELTIGIAGAVVGKPLRRVARLIEEQRAGLFLHRIRRGGVGALGRTAERLNDHAEDLAQRLQALPAQQRARLPASLAARIAIGRPSRLRLSSISDIRPALFLLSVATEIATAFLPVYARDASRPDWLRPELAAAAPLLAYLVAVAALAPFSGALARRFGARRLFVVSMLPIGLALVAMGTARGALEIAFWRGVIGVFYALATVACQEYALRAADEGMRGRALGGYLAVVYAGVFGGSALGGVVADRFGFTAAFLLAATVAAMAALFALAAMSGRAGSRDPDADRPAVPAAAARPASRRALRQCALLGGVTVPMNAATAIFVWFLLPLTLAADGLRSADIARVVMLYYLAAILLGPLVARLSEKPAGPSVLLGAGAFAAAGALLSLSVWDGYWAMAGATVGLGVAHTLMRGPQYVLALHLAASGGPGAGALRLCERLGAIAGLAACTFLLRDLGAAESIRLLGVAVLGGAILFVAVEWPAGLRRN